MSIAIVSNGATLDKEMARGGVRIRRRAFDHGNERDRDTDRAAIVWREIATCAALRAVPSCQGVIFVRLVASGNDAVRSSPQISSCRPPGNNPLE